MTDEYSLLKQSTAQLETATTAMERLAADAPWSKQGYFDGTQDDEIEHLFFRFLVSRRVLVSLALLLKQKKNAQVQQALDRADSSFADSDNTNDDGHALRTMISLAAGLSLFYYEGRLVQAFQNDKVAVAKLNEEFYRSDIPRDTFRTLRLECTDTTADGRLRSLAKAYNTWHEHYSNDADLLAHNEQAKELAALILDLYTEAREILEGLVKGQSIFLPPKSVTEKAHHAKSKAGDKMKEVRAHTFKGVSRLKSPTAHLIQFSDEQKRDVLSRLQPGDLIFTYTAGYMSDVFIPGAFKHGITFVGSPENRAEVGLTAERVAKQKDDLPEGEAAKLLEHFQVSTVPQEPGEKEVLDADVIEAVAEGVIFNNLCRLMDTHVNRLLVLRPCITSEERTDALIDIFRYLGAKYDFGFNFADASTVVCTEIQYHAFNGKGQLKFELVKHTGHLALSADDIANFYLANPTSFEFVLLALEDPKSTQHEAKIHSGDDGKNALAGLMAS